jgi:NAD(P)-dependent dehydrogenase (short-subunit alcohol dehydrogenase family)
MGTGLRNAIVTGGASGIGRAICLRLAAAGIDFAVFDVNISGAEDTMRQAGDNVRTLALSVDVADGKAVRAAVAEARERLGPAQILVNVAGIGEFCPFNQLTEEQWDRMISVHLKGTFNCARAAVDDMAATGWGRIVNMASVAGLNGGGPGLAHYSAAKGGIIGLTKALAHELGPLGITVNAIAPGLIDTPMIRDSAVSQQIIQYTKERTPMRRVGLPDDIAAACSYLVADDASFITGQIISPNGGAYM